MSKIWTGIILLVFALSIAASSFVFGWLSRFVIEGVTPDLALQCATALGGLILALWSYRKTKEAESLARQFPQKAEIYEGLLEQIKSMQMENNPDLGRNPVDQIKLARTLLDIKYKAIIWGDQKLLDALAEIEIAAEDNIDLFDKWARLYEQMRKELDHKDSKGYGWQIIMLNLKQEDKPEFDKMKLEALKRRTLKTPHNQP